MGFRIVWIQFNRLRQLLSSVGIVSRVSIDHAEQIVGIGVLWILCDSKLELRLDFGGRRGIRYLLVSLPQR